MTGYHGSCHCGQVRFAVELDLAAGAFKCNCSICTKTRAWLMVVPSEQLRVLAGEDVLRDYQFGGHKIHHLFCGHCGVRTFARATSPEGRAMVAVRLNSLDDVDPAVLAAAPVAYLDGKHDEFTRAPEVISHL